LLKFHLPLVYPADWQIALLALRASSINGSTNVQAHVYGLSSTNWSQSTVTWNNAPNLAQNVPPGYDYPNNFVLGAGDSAQVVGQLVAGNTAADRYVDVTRYLRAQPAGRDVSFLLAREVRFYGDIQDDDGIAVTTKEADPTHGPRLLLVRLKESPVQLNITRSGPTVALSWPTNSPGFVLESAPAVRLPASWTTVGASPAVTETNYTLSLQVTNPATFFRLRK
ncbi:MAG: hypothetical protein DME25_06465, partial [Verrucomicrobia bacterium]